MTFESKMNLKSISVCSKSIKITATLMMVEIWVDETQQYLIPLKSKNSLIILLLVVRKKKNKKRRKKTAGSAKAFIVRHFFCAHWSLLDVSSVVMDCNSTAKVVTTISHKKVHEWVVVCRSIFKHRSVRVLHRNAGFMYRQNHCSPVKLTYPNFGTWDFVMSHFGMEQHVHRSVLWTFWKMDVSAQERFNMGTFGTRNFQQG